MRRLAQAVSAAARRPVASGCALWRQQCATAAFTPRRCVHGTASSASGAADAAAASGAATGGAASRVPMVVFVNGGPGSGKGTQCARLADEFRLHHTSAGDLLRAELARYNRQRQSQSQSNSLAAASASVSAAPEAPSVHGPLIARMIDSGQILPAYVTIALLRDEFERVARAYRPPPHLTAASAAGAAAAATAAATTCSAEQALRHAQAAGPVFVVDGFPRSVENLTEYEALVGPARAMLTISCSPQTLKARLLKRGETSGRTDDTSAIADKRLETFTRDTAPVLQRFATDPQRALRTVDGSGDRDAVYRQTREAFLSLITFLTSRPY